MKNILVLVLIVALASIASGSVVNVVIETNFGDIGLELYPDDAPVTVGNFLSYASSDFYDGLIFHRVIENFVIQGGAYDAALNYYPGGAPIINEGYNGLSNVRGTIAMARTSDPNSATSQFYINQVDNPFLDSQLGGFCVFGRVIDGLSVVDAIAQTPTHDATSPNMGWLMSDVPINPVIIYNVTPEPCSLALLSLGGLFLRRRERLV